MNIENYFYKADELFNEEKFEEAFKLLLLGANSGDTSCMTRVALMYADGQGVEKDMDKSLHWDMEATEKGDYSGALNAGISFKFLNMHEKAKEYFNKALDLGNGEAAFELALIHKRDGGI